MFFFEFCEIFKNSFFTEPLRTTAAVTRLMFFLKKQRYFYKKCQAS